EVVGTVATHTLQLVEGDELRPERRGEILAFDWAHAELHLAALHISRAPIVHDAKAGDVSLSARGIQVATTHADDGGDLELEVELAGAWRNCHIVLGSRDRVWTREVEDRELVPVRLHVEPAALPRGAHVLLESV